MTRLIVGAIAAAAAAGLILYQMRGAAELALWEILLLALVLIQYRGIPGKGDPLEKPLFRLPSHDPVRLPQDVASAELAVIDATSGYLSPDRRLRPMLKRISSHRLGRHGIELDSTAAREALGEKAWAVLMRSDDEAIELGKLDFLVTTLEDL